MYQEPEYPSFSQLNQDRWVIQSAKNLNKFFVEVGAHDGLSYSNTLLLEQSGWDGLCIEPNPELFERLKLNRTCQKSNLAAHSVSNQTVNFQCSGVYGGIRDYMTEAEAEAFPGEIVEVKTATLDDILTAHGCPKNIGYISIDTEGNELEIVKVFPFDKWNVELWTIEHNDHTRNDTSRSSELISLFENFEYKYHLVNFDVWFYR